MLNKAIMLFKTYTLTYQIQYDGMLWSVEIDIDNSKKCLVFVIFKLYHLILEYLLVYMS